jgi:glycosyltransferase involved in cell wall biosynthesis
MGEAISVVIPTFNRRETLKIALVALFKQDYPHSKYEIIVVDDYSSDATKEEVLALAKTTDVALFYYANDKAKGQLTARNLGFSKAKGEFVASTDDDMWVDEHWLKTGLAYFTSSDIAAVEGRVIAIDPKEGPFYHNMSMQGKTYPTGNIFYRKSILEQTGGLDLELNLWHNYGSHYCLGLKILAMGKNIVYAHDVLAYHPSYEIKAVTVIKNSLKSGAIAYIYKTYGRAAIPYLGFKVYRLAVSLLAISFLISLIFVNYLAALIAFFALVAMIIIITPSFIKAGLPTQCKTLLVYTISYLFATFAFFYGCLRYRIMPNKNMLRL